MADEIDIYRSANLLMKQFGIEEAKNRAIRNSTEMLNRNDILGAAAWRAMLRAIEELESLERNDKPLH